MRPTEHDVSQNPTTDATLPGLTELGFTPFFSAQLALLQSSELVPARIAADGPGAYTLLGCASPSGELAGKLRHALTPAGYPVTGDWVAVDTTTTVGTIRHLLDRRTVLKRRAAGRAAVTQVVAANVDVFFIVTSANRDLNPRRLERYVAAVLDGGANPVIVVNKVDLVPDPAPLVARIGAIGRATPVVCVSAHAGIGLDELRTHVSTGTTIGLVGSSGVGKSTLVNRLLDREAITTGIVRDDGKGRHTTTRRELVVLPGGGVLLDTPGLRELGLVDDAGGLDAAFPELATFADSCRFRDCSHDGEPGCAVATAVARGDLDPNRLASYQRLQREIAAAEARRNPALGANTKRRWKTISKAVRAASRAERDRRR
jgi:ribosome biogenesis GTPase